ATNGKRLQLLAGISHFATSIPQIIPQTYRGCDRTSTNANGIYLKRYCNFNILSRRSGANDLRRTAAGGHSLRQEPLASSFADLQPHILLHKNIWLTRGLRPFAVLESAGLSMGKCPTP